MEINGVPVHPLVVHAAVVLIPLAALTGALYALIPKWRYRLRHPTLALAVLAVVLSQVASFTGQDLQDDRDLRDSLVETHEMWAGRLELGVLAFAVVALVAWWVLPHVTALVGGSDRSARLPVLARPSTVLLPVAAVAVLVLAYLTGEAGAQAVWNGD